MGTRINNGAAWYEFNKKRKPLAPPQPRKNKPGMIDCHVRFDVAGSIVVTWPIDPDVDLHLQSNKDIDSFVEACTGSLVMRPTVTDIEECPEDYLELAREQKRTRYTNTIGKHIMFLEIGYYIHECENCGHKQFIQVNHDTGCIDYCGREGSSADKTESPDKQSGCSWRPSYGKYGCSGIYINTHNGRKFKYLGGER